MRSMMRLAMLLLLAAPAVAQRPDFTGIWQLTTSRSKLTIPDPPVTSTFIFIHREPNWHMERTHFFRDAKPNTIHFDRVLGGGPDTKKDGDDVTISRMFWQGNTVVLDQQITGADNNHGSNHVVYGLSADRRQLTALEHEEFPDAKYTNSWVFDRVPMPVMRVTYAASGLSEEEVAKLNSIVERDHGDCDAKGSTLEIDYALHDLGELGTGVFVRSKRACDCGATGNCTTYVYQRHGNAFHEVPFLNDATPSGWAFGVTKMPSGELLLAVGSNASGGMQSETFYQLFQDKFVELGSVCFRSRNPAGPRNSASWFDPREVTSVSCASR